MPDLTEFKCFNVTLIRSDQYTISIAAENKEEAESKALAMDSTELMQKCNSCEATDLFCLAQEEIPEPKTEPRPYGTYERQW
jgi:hypothetical protein